MRGSEVRILSPAPFKLLKVRLFIRVSRLFCLAPAWPTGADFDRSRIPAGLANRDALAPEPSSLLELRQPIPGTGRPRRQQTLGNRITQKVWRVPGLTLQLPLLPETRPPAGDDFSLLLRIIIILSPDGPWEFRALAWLIPSSPP